MTFQMPVMSPAMALVVNIAASNVIQRMDLIIGSPSSSLHYVSSSPVA